jgi:hypothetical protein
MLKGDLLASLHLPASPKYLFTYKRTFAGILALLLFGACAVSAQTYSFYVAPNGSDSNPGTLAAPFATLGRCQRAMEDSSKVKTCTLRAGTYNLSAGLAFLPADSGETWQYYPADGVNSAVVNGQFAVNPVTGTAVSTWTWNGVKIENYLQWGIYIQSTQTTNANNITIENSEITGNTFVSPTSPGAGIVLQGNIFNSLISHNYIHAIGDSAIQVFDGFQYSGANLNDVVIDSNVLLNTNREPIPAGATAVIYVNFHAGSEPLTRPLQITNNFIRDYGNPATQAVGNAIGFDTGGCCAVVKGNVIGPPAYAGPGLAGAVSNGSDPLISTSDGHDVSWTNNIVDLGLQTYGPYDVAYLVYNDGILNNSMIKNTYSCNIILSNYTGRLLSSTGVQYFQGGGPPWPGNGVLGVTIDNNYYWNYASGGRIFTTGTIIGDSNPINQNPQISGYLYTIASGSPVFGFPCDFADVSKARAAGPPGFTIPSSSNHSD